MKKVALNISKMSIALRIAKARSIVIQMNSNPYFPSPTVPLINITNAADAAEAAYNKALAGTKADTADMYFKVRALELLLVAQAGYVEYIANQSGSVQEAVDIIISAGMDVRAQGSVNVQELSAKSGIAEGTVQLRRKAVRAAAYRWRKSTNNIDWEIVGDSTVSRFIAEDLEPLTRYYFSVAIVKGQLQEPWSDSITFVVPK